MHGCEKSRKFVTDKTKILNQLKIKVMKTFLITIIKTNGAKVSFQVNASSETIAYNKTRRNWGKELKSVYDIEELF